MIQSARARRWRRHTFAFPGIEADMMMVSSSREKDSRVTVGRGHLESEYVPIESERSLDISDSEVDMSDDCFWMNGHTSSIKKFSDIKIPPEK
jgi:hypothetical protein